MSPLSFAERAMLLVSLSCYFSGALQGLAFMFATRARPSRLSTVAITAGFTLHTAYLGWHWWRLGVFPVGAARFEGLLLLTWAIILVYLLARWRTRTEALPAFVMPVVVVAYGVAFLSANQPDEGTGYFDNPWTLSHIVAAMLSYATFVVAFVLGVMYLIQERQLKAKRLTRLTRRLPPIETIEALIYKSLLVGFPLLTYALVLGVVQVRGLDLDDPAWRDPKVIAAAVTWLFYAIVLASRIRRWLPGHRLAYLSIVGFGGVLFTYIVSGMLSQGHPFR